MSIWNRMFFKRSGEGGAGTVTGPASSTDNAIPRWDGAAGDKLKNSGVLIDGSDSLILPNGAIAFTKEGGAAKTILQPSAGVQFPQDRGVEWCDAAAAGNAPTAGLSRSATGVVSADSSTRGDGLGKLKLGGMRIVGYTSSAAGPTTTEYPNDKDFGIHKNTTTGVKSIAFNDGGSVVTIAMA